MSGSTGRPSLNKGLALAAMAVGIAAGSYGIASAATGPGSATTTAATTTTMPAAAPSISGAPPGATNGNPWGHQRSDETLLTGDALAKVTAIAQSKASGATIVRVETDADGVAAYEAHMTKADGTPVTVFVDSGFQFLSMS